MPEMAARKIIDIASLLHNRMAELADIARQSGNEALAQKIEDCKLDLANQITAVVLELQIRVAPDEKWVGQ